MVGVIFIAVFVLIIVLGATGKGPGKNVPRSRDGINHWEAVPGDARYEPRDLTEDQP